MTILIMDSDLGFAFWLGRVLAASGYQVLPAKKFSDASSFVNGPNTEIDLLIVNPFLDGAGEFVDLLRRPMARVKILVVRTGDEQPADAIQGVDLIARKPLKQDAAAAKLWATIVWQVLSR